MLFDLPAGKAEPLEINVFIGCPGSRWNCFSKKGGGEMGSLSYLKKNIQFVL